MASAFSITTATNSVPIGKQRRATVLFTVTNRSDQPLTGRSVLVMDPPNEAQSIWLQLKPPQESERHFEVNGVEDYIVEVNVPLDAVAGDYLFHLDMVDIDNPDETYTVGSTVKLRVAAPEPPKKEKKPFPWWIIAVAVGVLGVIALAIFWPRPPRVIVHTATSSNTHGNSTEIDDDRTNNNPKAIILVTQNWNPPGQSQVYNNHPIGVLYTGSRWAIFNQDGAEMPEGASFNVQIRNAGRGAFVHTTTSSNIGANLTGMDNARAKNNLEAIILVTPNLTAPGQNFAVYFNHPIGVMLQGRRWMIFNQDLADMPTFTSFNVQILNAGTDAFVHTATSSNIIGNWTEIDHARTNNNPEAIIFVTPNLSPPPEYNGAYVNHPIGVWYRSEVSRWAIFNQDIAEMPQGASFNVLILDSQ